MDRRRNRSRSIASLRLLATMTVLGWMTAAHPAAALDIIWTNTLGGNWNSAANWNSGAGPVPGPADVAHITTGGTYTVTLDVDPTVAGLNVGATLGTQTLFLNSRTITLNGASSVNANGVLSIRSSTISGAGTLTAAGRLLATGTSVVNATLATAVGSIVRVEGNSTAGNAQLTVANGFTNLGTIELSAINDFFNSVLNVTNGTLVNAAGSTINVMAGTGGSRVLGAQLDNQGTLQVGIALSLGRSSADHMSSGTINVSGGNLTVVQGGTSPSFTNTGSITVSAGRTLGVSGGTVSQNGGTLGGAGTLSLTSGNSTMFNTPIAVGALSLNAAAATLTSDLSTATTVVTLVSSTLNGAVTVTNAAGRTLLCQSSTINPALINQGTLQAPGIGALNGALTTAVGSIVRVQGNSTAGNGQLTVANGFTNLGTIELSAINDLFNSILNVTNGTLVNAAGSTINVMAGTGGSRVLGAQLDNQGTLQVGIALSLGRSSADHMSSGTINVSGGNLTVAQSGTSPSFTNTGSITVNSGRALISSTGTFVNAAGGLLQGTGACNFGSTFTNAGTIGPGVSPGILSITGNAPFVGGNLAIEIGGLAAGSQYDRLVVSGTATVGDTLEASFPVGFCTAPGDSFRVLTAGTRVGTFAAIVISGEGNPVLDPRYDATGLSLVTVSNLLTIGASAGANGSIAPSSPVQVACGDDQPFTITPDPCYHVADVLVDGVSVGPVTGYTFLNVTEHHTISATFAINTYTISASAGPGGSINPAGEVSVNCGSDQVFDMIPAPGYAVAVVLVDGKSVGAVASYEFTNVTSARTIAASFMDLAPPTVQVLAPNGGEVWTVSHVRVIRWTATDNAAVDSAHVEYSLLGPTGPWTTVAHVAGSVDSVEWTIPNQCSDSARVRVVAFDAAGNSGADLSNAGFKLRCGTLSAGGLVASELHLRVPSPIRSAPVRLLLSSPTVEEATVEILSVSGRRLWTRRLSGLEGTREVLWDGRGSTGEDVHPGVYFARLVTPAGRRSVRFVLLR